MFHLPFFFYFNYTFPPPFLSGKQNLEYQILRWDPEHMAFGVNLCILILTAECEHYVGPHTNFKHIFFFCFLFFFFILRRKCHSEEASEPKVWWFLMPWELLECSLPCRLQQAAYSFMCSTAVNSRDTLAFVVRLWNGKYSEKWTANLNLFSQCCEFCSQSRELVTKMSGIYFLMGLFSR